MKIAVLGTGRIGAFHARTLAGLPEVEALVLTDVVPESASAAVAAIRGESGLSIDVEHALTLQEALAAGPDAVVITSATHTHADLLGRAIGLGVPTFCEKPVAGTLRETVDLARLERDTGALVHIGFQRRFDLAYQRVRAAVAHGELGFVHHIRAATMDQSPPHAAYLPGSGGIFRDCNVHDFDIIRFVSGGEVATAYAVGANKGEKFFTEAGDVDSGAALLTLQDGTIAVVTSTRYNGAGHDVRMEVHGSKGALAVGLDDSLALTSAEPGVTFPPGPRHRSFLERFLPAYGRELAAFVEMVQGERPSPCTVADGLQAARIAEACDRSRKSGQPVHLADVPGL